MPDNDKNNKFKVTGTTHGSKPLAVIVKRQKRTDNLLLKDRKKKNQIMNSQRTKQHICKRRHTSRYFSLQKSSFLADAPANIDTFAVI